MMDAPILSGLKSAAELAAQHPHGVRIRYMGGCRCLKCRMANANYEKQRAKARACGDWNGVVDAIPARKHIRKLSRQGVGYKMVAQAARTSSTIVLDIRMGRRTRARARTVRQILAVTAEMARGDAALVSAASTWRLIDLLLEEGFTKASLARHLGMRSPALQINRRRVTVRTRDAVWRLHRRLMS